MENCGFRNRGKQRHSWRLKPLLCAVLFASAGSGMGGLGEPAGAQALYDDAYSVQDIQVDATGDSATQARTKALAQGQAEAFKQVMGRVLPGSPVSMPDAGTLEALVSGMEVRDEKIAPNRYQALLNLQFDPHAMQSVLRGPVVKPAPDQPVTVSGSTMLPPAAATATAASAPIGSCVLVLPVWQDGSSAADAKLWEENGWQHAWLRYLAGSPNLPWILPQTSLQDMATLNAGQALEGDFQSIIQLAQHYHCPQAAVVSVRPGYHQGKQHLVVERYLWSKDKPVESATYYVPRELGDETAFAEAADRVASGMRDSPALANAAGVAPATGPISVLALVPILDLDQWVETRRRLGKAGGIRSTEIRAMSDQQVDLELQLVVPVAQLEKSLQLQGLQVEPQQGYIVIRPLAEAKPAAPGAGAQASQHE